MAKAYYNEIDPKAAAWLRQLIAAGLIAPGDVDERSIEDVKPSDLAGYTQCHFFAGIGVWSYALRLAGWPDDKPVWTGSCPCFPAGTLVLTREGYKSIEDVQVGDEVLTHKARWRKVTHVGSEVSELVKVKGQGHWGLICTPDHPFLVGEDTWAPAADLVGQRWRTVADVPTCAIPPIQDARGVSFVAGRYRASGTRDGKTVYLGRFSSEEGARAAREHALSSGLIKVRGADAVDTSSIEFARFLGYWVGDGWTSRDSVFICGPKEAGPFLEELFERAGMRGVANLERTSSRARCGSTALTRWLAGHFGSGASGKRIPAWLHGAPLAYRSAFLQGYFEADGHTENENTCWTTVSRALAVGVRVLLNQSGRSASITEHVPNRTAVIEGRTVNERTRYRVTSYANMRSFSFDGQHGAGLVRSVSEAGTGRVFNLAVDEDESYTADGIVVHNCQPFSAAGKGEGFADERHLWPAMHHLIEQCKPAVWFGEQVASKDGLGWLDLVQADVEASGYAFGAADLCAAGVGAPHIRQRLYIAAVRLDDAVRARLEGHGGDGCHFDRSGRISTDTAGSAAEAGAAHGLADPQRDGGGREASASDHLRSETLGPTDLGSRRGGASGRLADADDLEQRIGGDAGSEAGPRSAHRADANGRSVSCGLGDTDGERSGRDAGEIRREEEGTSRESGSEPDGAEPAGAAGELDDGGRPGPTNGRWRDADWLFCRDGKWRPVQPGTFPLVDGTPSRVGRLRGYGNGIVAQNAEAFIRSVREVIE